MWLIISLVLIGLVLLIAELVLLPGISVAGIGALLSFIGAVSYAYIHYGILMGSIVLTVIIILVVATIVVSLRANTWQHFSLKATIDSTSTPTPQQHNIRIGQRGVAITRLGPIGNVRIADITLEARSLDAYIDPREEIEVVDFDNTLVVVQKVKQE